MARKESSFKELTIELDQDLPLRESVFNTLRKNILSGELGPGEHLTEIRLGRMLGTSRTPIREAIRKLEKEGLVVIHPGSGAVVAPISEKDLKDVLEVRRNLDVLCARLASLRITAEDKQRLTAACRAFAQQTATSDHIAIAKADVDMHDIIAAAAGNRLLLEILNGLADQVYRYRFEYIKDDMHYDRLVAEHTAIVSAIVEGDEERAAAAAAEHIDNQERSILAQLRRENAGRRRE